MPTGSKSASESKDNQNCNKSANYPINQCLKHQTTMCTIINVHLAHPLKTLLEIYKPAITVLLVTVLLRSNILLYGRQPFDYMFLLSIGVSNVRSL